MRHLDEELLEAAYRGDRMRVQCLLAGGTDARAVAEYGEAALTRAVECGNAAVALLLLESGVQFDFSKNDARHLLYAACLSGSEETVELLAGLGAMPPDELPPLSYAIVRNRMNEVQSLLDRGISPEWRDADDSSPLETAVAHNSLQAAECLLQRGANPVAPTSLMQVPLALAAEDGLMSMAELLLRLGTDINAVPYDGGCTALMVAAKADNADMVRFLLEHGADTEVADVDEWTALFYAQSAAVAQLLLQYSANPHAKDNIDCTPLETAIKFGEDDALVTLLETATKGRGN